MRESFRAHHARITVPKRGLLMSDARLSSTTPCPEIIYTLL